MVYTFMKGGVLNAHAPFTNSHSQNNGELINPHKYDGLVYGEYNKRSCRTCHIYVYIIIYIYVWLRHTHATAVAAPPTAATCCC